MFDSMMQFLAGLFVQKPLNIFLVAGLFFALYLLMRFTGLGEGRNYGAVLVPTVAWALYAAYEWAVVYFTPEANIRVDLMLIWPILLILSIWFLIRAFRPA